MRRRLVCYFQKNPEVKQGRDPENYVKNQRAEKLRKHHLPVAYWNSRKRLDGAELKFFGEQAHCDERKNQNECEPEEDRVKECFLNRVLHLALVHERDLKIEIDPANDQEKDEHDVGDRGVKITAHLAREKGIKLTHG